MEKMKRFKLDNYIIEYYHVSDKVCNRKKLFNIYLQYNNLKSQVNFIIDLENIHSSFFRAFTERQSKIIINKLEKECC